MAWGGTVSTHANAEAVVPTKGTPEVHRYVLENGLTLLVAPRHHAPVFSAIIMYRVGSVDEPSGATGIAHMYEHMAFKGTRRIGTTNPRAEARLLRTLDRLTMARDRLVDSPTSATPGGIKKIAGLTAEIDRTRAAAKALVVPNELGDIYRRNGGVGLNAGTSADVTTYYISLPRNRLPLWAQLESERMAAPVLREFYDEREVVLEERRMRVDTNPRGRLYEAFKATAFTAHPYRNPVIGWASDLNRLTRPATRAFFERHYVPANTVISLVGDLDPDSVHQMITRTFGKLPATPPAAAPPTVEPVPAGPRHTTVYDDAGPALLMGFHKPSIHDPADIVLDVVQLILSGGISSRLTKSLVLDRQMAVSVSASNGSGGARYPNLFVFSATPRQPHTPDELEQALLEQIHRLRTEPVSERELIRATNQARVSTLRRLRSNMGLARVLAFGETLVGDWRYGFDLPDRIAEVTAADIQRVAQRYLDPNLRIVAVRQRPPESTQLKPTRPDTATPATEARP